MSRSESGRVILSEPSASEESLLSEQVTPYQNSSASLRVGTQNDIAQQLVTMSKQTERQIQHSFGFQPENSTHHFLVTIPTGQHDSVEISEHFSWDSATGSSEISYGSRTDGQIRVRLARLKWDAIADELRAQFNRRLKKYGQKSGNWKTGPNLVRRELGKELTLLAWAIEDADPGLIPAAIANWRGLEPEERWWLYTQTAAATGHGLTDRGRGWRRAVRYALTENPVTDQVSAEAVLPEYFRRAADAPLFNMINEDDTLS